MSLNSSPSIVASGPAGPLRVNVTHDRDENALSRSSVGRKVGRKNEAGLPWWVAIVVELVIDAAPN